MRYLVKATDELNKVVRYEKIQPTRLDASKAFKYAVLEFCLIFEGEKRETQRAVNSLFKASKSVDYYHNGMYFEMVPIYEKCALGKTLTSEVKK